MCKYVRRLETEDTLYLPRKQKQPSFEDCFFGQFSLFCLVITLYNVKGYAAFHKTSTADAVPEVFCSLATSQSIFALQKLLLRRTLFRCAKQVRQSLYPPRKQKQPSFEDCFFSSIFPFLPCYNFIQCKGVRCVSQNFDR